MEKPPPYTAESATLQLPAVPSGALDSPKASSIPVTGQLQQQQYPLNRPVPDNELTPQLSRRNDLSPSTTADLPKVPTHSPGTKLPVLEQSRPNRDSSAAIEDPDDRTAAEALLGLGKVPKQEPTHKFAGYSTPLKYYPIGIEHTTTQTQGQQPEPLLSLLTSSHPWLGGTLNGSLSAYSTSKSYSPRFIQYGADLVETTVGTVGRKTGVEGSIRRYLDARQPQPASRIDAKLLDPQTARDLAVGAPPARKTSAASIDSLPLYDDNRSPAYEEAATAPQSPSRSWSTQLMISTSGLGAALNDNALRSLKFCLALLSGANRHVRYLIEALKRLLQDYNSNAAGTLEDGRPRDVKTSGSDTAMPDAPPDPPGLIAARIKTLNAEIWTTLKNVVTNVSAYTGGALPENASMVVKWQLMSVPQRWQRAVLRANSETGGGEEDAVASANRMIEFAVEGLDMMDQVGGVVESTIRSAERWLDSMGRRKEGGAEGEGNEVVMGDRPEEEKRGGEAGGA